MKKEITTELDFCFSFVFDCLTLPFLESDAGCGDGSVSSGPVGSDLDHRRSQMLRHGCPCRTCSPVLPLSPLAFPFVGCCCSSPEEHSEVVAVVLLPTCCLAGT